MVDKIKSQLAKQTQKFTDIESQSKKLQEMLEKANTIKGKLAGLTEERDSAIAKMTNSQAMVKKVMGQLAEQTKKITGLEGHNIELQKLIDELKKKISTGIKLPSMQ
jgi:predicted  nucleic acid-binding Zn-ribbon protein